MAYTDRDWENLGRSIQDIVDRAVNSHNFEQLSETIRQAVDTGTEAIRKAAAPVSRETENVVVEPKKKNLPVLYGTTGGKHTTGVLKIVGGSIAEVVSLGLLSAAEFMGFMPFFVSTFSAIPGVLGGVAFLGGLWLIVSGINTLGMVKRFKVYRRVLGEKTQCTLDRLARSVGKSVQFVRRDLSKMFEEGLFLEGHLDNEGTCLITSDETYRYFEQSRRQLEQRQREEAAEQARKANTKQDPRVMEVLDKGNAFIAEIRRCNDAIPGVEISAKIDRMETIVRRIFERAESHPEIVPDLKKLMDYYLPMTVKLLNAYADMDAQPVQGETIQASKREIEATLDTLNLAFEKLLDSVFADTALDISSDITVLNTLLAQEGLTEDDLSKMKKQQKQ